MTTTTNAHPGLRALAAGLTVAGYGLRIAGTIVATFFMVYGMMLALLFAVPPGEHADLDVSAMIAALSPIPATGTFGALAAALTILWVGVSALICGRFPWSRR